MADYTQPLIKVKYDGSASNLKVLQVVNGYVTLPEPAAYDSNTATLVDGGRNAAGITIGAVIREDVAKVSMNWKYLSIYEWADILTLFSSKRGGKFYATVNFFLQDTADWTERTMYVSDRQAKMFIRDTYGRLQGYENPSFSIVEV